MAEAVTRRPIDRGQRLDLLGRIGIGNLEACFQIAASFAGRHGEEGLVAPGRNGSRERFADRRTVHHARAASLSGWWNSSTTTTDDNASPAISRNPSVKEPRMFSTHPVMTGARKPATAKAKSMMPSAVAARSGTMSTFTA